MTPLKIYLYLLIIFITSLSIKFAEAGTTVDKNSNLPNQIRDETSETTNAVETHSNNETTTTTKHTTQSTQPTSVAQNVQPTPETQNQNTNSTDPLSPYPILEPNKGDTIVYLVTDGYIVTDLPFFALEYYFNLYSKKNNLGIHLKKQVFKDIDNVVGYNSGDDEINTFFGKSNKYELIAFDSHYLGKFSPYLEQLDNDNYYYIKDDINRYQTKNNKMLIQHNDHIYGIPFFMIVSVLFANKKLLLRYGMSIPRTWEQLIQTAQYIVDQEENAGNKNLIGYNGLFPDANFNENTLCSLYQFLYSFRENPDDDIPPFNSTIAESAIDEILKIRDTVSSTQSFRMPEPSLLDQMKVEKVLFSHFFSSCYNSISDKYYLSLLPGKKEGINSSVIGGFALGLNKKCSDTRKEKALEVLKYAVSKEFQRDVIVKELGYFTALEELYHDPETCSYHPFCDFLNNVQYYLRPSGTMKNYKEFSRRTVKYFHELLDGKLTPRQLLNKIEDINKYYTINTKSTLGLILLVITSIIMCCVIGTTCLIFVKKLKHYFKFLTTDLWIIYALGSVFLLCSVLSYFNETTELKCALREEFIINGYSLILIPLVFKLISNFPLVNKLSSFAINNKNVFVFGLYFIQLILTLIFVFMGKISMISINDGNEEKNFYKCYNGTALGKAIFYIQVAYGIALYFAVCLLIFFEWNITETHFEVRQFSVVVIIEGITLALLLILNIISFKNYLLYNLLFIFINFISVIVNHFYIFVVRTLISVHNETYNKSEEKIIGDMVQNNKYTNTSSSDNNRGTMNKSNGSIYSGNSKDYKSKLIGLHFAKVAQNNSQIMSPTTHYSSKNYSYESGQNSNTSFQRGNSQSLVYDSYYRPS